MSRTSWTRAIPGTGVALALAISAAAVVPSVGSAASPPSKVEVDVVELNVNHRFDEPLGIGDSRPVLGWRMTSDMRDGSPCFDPTAGGVCPLDRQSSYEIEAAASVADLEAGNLIWDSGRVRSSQQNNVPFGVKLDLGTPSPGECGSGTRSSG